MSEQKDELDLGLQEAAKPMVEAAPLDSEKAKKGLTVFLNKKIHEKKLTHISIQLIMTEFDKCLNAGPKTQRALFQTMMENLKQNPKTQRLYVVLSEYFVSLNLPPETSQMEAAEEEIEIIVEVDAPVAEAVGQEPAPQPEPVATPEVAPVETKEVIAATNDEVAAVLAPPVAATVQPENSTFMIDFMKIADLHEAIQAFLPTTPESIRISISTKLELGPQGEELENPDWILSYFEKLTQRVPAIEKDFALHGMSLKSAASRFDIWLKMNKERKAVALQERFSAKADALEPVGSPNKGRRLKTLQGASAINVEDVVAAAAKNGTTIILPTKQEKPAEPPVVQPAIDEETTTDGSDDEHQRPTMERPIAAAEIFGEARIGQSNRQELPTISNEAGPQNAQTLPDPRALQAAIDEMDSKAAAAKQGPHKSRARAETLPAIPVAQPALDEPSEPSNRSKAITLVPGQMPAVKPAEESTPPPSKGSFWDRIRGKK